jgi:hypothetical protein
MELLFTVVLLVTGMVGVTEVVTVVITVEPVDVTGTVVLEDTMVVVVDKLEVLVL